MTITIRIADQDIPITVTHWQPATPHNLSGHPDSWHEGDAEELEYSVDCPVASAFIEHFSLYDYFDGMVRAAILSKKDANNSTDFRPSPSRGYSL